MAHIRRVQTGYQVRYREAGGRERAKNFDRRVDAEAHLTTVEGQKLRGDYVDPDAGRMTIAEWSTLWVQAARPTLKPKTSASYDSLIRSRILPTFGPTPLAAIRPTAVQAWVGHMVSEGLSASRIRQAHVVLSSMLDAAVRDNRIGRNAAHKARLPRLEHHEAAFLEAAVVDRIIRAAPKDYRAFLAVQGILGLRFGEAAALRRRSANLLRRRLLISESLAEIQGALIFGPTKSYASRTAPLSPAIVEMLAKRMEDVDADPDALIFTSPDGDPVRYANFRNRVWVPLLLELGLPHVGMHALRHSAVARMIAAGWAPKAIQQTLGHSSVAFTLDRYGHLFETDMDALAEALDTTGAAALR